MGQLKNPIQFLYLLYEVDNRPAEWVGKKKKSELTVLLMQDFNFLSKERNFFGGKKKKESRRK